MLKNLLSSRKFWAAFLTLAVVIVGMFIPDYTLDVEHAVGFVVIATTYIIGTAVDPGIGWKGLLSSRKFWAAVIGFVVLILDSFKLVVPFGLTPDVLVTIIVTIGAFITGTALEGSPTEPTA